MRLNLALQGGGGHGAYTWGVLDRLLDDDGLEIGDICGTSAGALNGAALLTGLARAGREGARENLARLWRQVAEAGFAMSLLQVPLRKPGLGVWDDAMPLLSPYHANPLAMEPLRYILASTVDVDLLRRPPGSGPALWVDAVNVNSGHTRTFGPDDLSVSAILASACAPFLFQAVQIDGESYWDGSYGANPSLWPLYEGRGDVDLLLVELAPIARPETPTTAKNILNRINELASVAALVSQLRLMDSVTARSGQAVRTHLVSLPETVARAEIEPSTKRTIDPLMFESLRQQGHQACDAWLARHRDALGRRSSCDLARRYGSPHAPAGRAMPRPAMRRGTSAGSSRAR